MAIRLDGSPCMVTVGGVNTFIKGFHQMAAKMARSTTMEIRVPAKK